MAGTESVDRHIEGPAVQVLRLPVFGQVIGRQTPFHTAVGRRARVGGRQCGLGLGDMGGSARCHGRRCGRRPAATAAGGFAVQFEEGDILLSAGIAAELSGACVVLQEAGRILNIVGTRDTLRRCAECPPVFIRRFARAVIQGVAAGIQSIVIVAHLHGITGAGLLDADVVGLGGFVWNLSVRNAHRGVRFRVAVTVQHQLVRLIHDQVIARPIRLRLGHFHIVLADRRQRSLLRLLHADSQGVAGILLESLGDARDNSPVGGLVGGDRDGELGQLHREDAHPEPEVAGGIDGKVVGQDRYARDAGGGELLGIAEVNDDVAGQFGSVLRLQDDVLHGFVGVQGEILQRNVPMGRQSRPNHGNGSVRKAAPVAGGGGCHQVRGRVEGGRRGRLDLGHGGEHVRRVAEVRLGYRRIHGIEMMGADEVGRETPGHAESRREAVLRQGVGGIQVRSHKTSVHGVRHTDGVAGGPFDGLTVPPSAGGRIF